jgi:multidrug resistance efflux pump
MQEVKTLKSTMRGQDATISYFRKKVEELTKDLEQAKKEKAKAKADFRKVEHLSQHVLSPRGDHDS